MLGPSCLDVSSSCVTSGKLLNLSVKGGDPNIYLISASEAELIYVKRRAQGLGVCTV